MTCDESVHEPNLGDRLTASCTVTANPSLSNIMFKAWRANESDPYISTQVNGNMEVRGISINRMVSDSWGVWAPLELTHSTLDKMVKLGKQSFVSPKPWMIQVLVSDPGQARKMLFNRLFRSRWKKTSKLRVTGLCAQNASKAENNGFITATISEIFYFRFHY